MIYKFLLPLWLLLILYKLFFHCITYFFRIFLLWYDGFLWWNQLFQKLSITLFKSLQWSTEFELTARDLQFASKLTQIASVYL